MIKRLDTENENQKPEDIRRSFDSKLGVSRWVTPLTPADEQNDEPEEQIDPLAPWWWHGEEEASTTFLTSMGVQL